MGNTVNIRRRQNVQAEQTLATVKAAGVFKARTKEAQAKRTNASQQIEEVLKLKFRRKSNVFGYKPIGRLAAVDGSPQINATSSQKDILKFVRRVNVSDKLAIKDTRVAWNALRDLASRERVPAIQDTGRGRFKLITDVVKFTQRTSMSAKKNKVAREFFYNDALITERETLCHLCHSSSIEEGPLNPCRICPRVYHTDCLAKQGHLSGDRAVETLALSNSKIGWSCCNCENLFDLLSDNEKIDIMETFDLMDTNQDSFINKEEYFSYKKEYYRKLLGREMPSYLVIMEERTFEDMDRNNNDLIDWWEFVIPMCVRKLSERRKRTLPALLTKQEIHKLRRFFKEYDIEGDGEIKEDLSRVVFKNWYLSLINLREEDIPIWDWLGNEFVKIDDKKEYSLGQKLTTVKWKDFVLNHALYILAARPNTGSMRPYVPQFNSLHSEFEEDDDDIEYY